MNKLYTSDLKNSSAKTQLKRRFNYDSKRIQKLLSSEYTEFEEKILVESSFVETTRDGRALRQVSLALTKKNLIVAADVCNKSNKSDCLNSNHIDPKTENFELISVFPLKFLRLSVFHRRSRCTIKVRFIVNGKVRYYELSERRNKILWIKWCTHIRNIVIQKANRSSLSETSAGSSSSIGSLYVPATDAKKRQIQYRKCYGQKFYNTVLTHKDKRNASSWSDKNIYMGEAYKELTNGSYKSVPNNLSNITLSEIKYQLGIEHGQSWPKYEQKLKRYKDRRAVDGDARRINRFGSDINENCQTKLFLKPIYESKIRHRNGSNETFTTMIDDGVRIWEKSSKKHPARLYGIVTLAHFLNAFGPWPIRLGERESVQLHRSLSVVNLCIHSIDPELSLPLSRRQLTSTISYNNLLHKLHQSNRNIETVNNTRVILFWTSDFWYRPKSAIVDYKQVQKHLSMLRSFQDQQKRPKSYNDKFFFGKKRNHKQEEKHCIVKRMFFTGQSKNKNQQKENSHSNNGIGQLRKLLKLNIKISAWDLDSTTLSRQLTLIERDLFLRIPTTEVAILIEEKSTRNAPNFGAWVAFSHRISCLVATEIVSIKRLDMRARLISRFIISADKLFHMGNFQSCRSILAGLQSPAVYRLRNTWNCLRKYYSTKYETMKKLCRIFHSPLMKNYEIAWRKCLLDPPCIPYVGDFVIKILDVHHYIDSHEIMSHERKKSVNDGLMYNTNSAKSKSKFLRYFFSAISIVSRNKNSKNKETMERRLSPKEKDLIKKYLRRWKMYTSRRKLENDNPRNFVIENVSSWLKKCQKMSQAYNFSGHPLAWEYLLKARYKEEKENFYISIQIEPFFL